MRSRTFAYAAGCALALASCEDGTGPDFGSANGDCGEITSRLRIEDKFRQESATFNVGEPITFNLAITNNGRAPTQLGYDGCGLIRVVVLGSHDQNVFDTLPEGTACVQLLQRTTYEPWETKSIDVAWNQTRRDGSQVAVGQYTVQARDRSLECKGELAAGARFAIQ